jgi:hypothetical protein
MESDGRFYLDADVDVMVSAAVLLCGVRIGFSGRRFVERTRRDFDRNTEFWGRMWKD